MPYRSAVLSVVLSFAATAAFAAITLPGDITAEAQRADGANVQWNAGADGPDDFNGRPQSSATCSPASNSLFPLGTTTVSCSGSDGSTGTFNVTVVDTTAPALQLPDEVRTSTDNSGAVVTFAAVANDIVDGSVAVSCSPASGSFFAVGTTKVHCTASDSRSNNANGNFEVVVTQNQPPPPPPPPSEQTITVEATGPNGAVVTYADSTGAGDDENGRPRGTCSTQSGSLFPLGTTVVTCTNVTLKIVVVDTTAPELTLPGSITRAATSPDGAVVTFNAFAGDLVDGSVAVTCAPASGTIFPIGATAVACSASDSRSNAASGSFVVEVTNDGPADTEAPDILSISASPNVLSPPNNSLREVTLTVDVQDAIDPHPTVTIFDVKSDESITGADWSVTGPLTVKLRATRDGNGDGRVYTIYVEAIDAAGNRSVATVTVTVPHDQGNASPVTSQPPPSKKRSVRG